jgi:hypothetical protein
MPNRKYQTFSYPNALPGSSTALTGIRNVNGSKHKVYITGFYKPTPDTSNTTISFVYKGTLSGKGHWYTLNYPSSPGTTVVVTNLYGPNNKHNGDLQVVGNYTTQETGISTIGCLYEGSINGDGQWTTIVPIPLSNDPILNTICHSTNGGLVVGNYDTILVQGKAFIYDIKKKTYHNINKPNAKSITSYGLWYNGKDRYTICGGYSNTNGVSALDTGYLVDWNNKKKTFSNWRSFKYNNKPAIITHFDGITTDGKHGYNLTGDAVDIDGKAHAFIAHVKNKHTNKAKWNEIQYPNSILTSGNSVYKTVIIGIYKLPNDDTINGYISF